MTSETIQIASGKLNIITEELNDKYTSVHDLIAFASRENKKRGFLFVSKILGKHIPVKPSVMREAYDLVANMMKTQSPTLVVGLAETATGLGAGVADSLSKMVDVPVLYQHTTRHDLNAPRWFEISEAHSHAVSHIVYEPHAELMEDVLDSSELILIDDEISTGKTLLQLAQEYMIKLPKVATIKLFSLVSWLDDEKQAWFEAEMNAFAEKSSMALPSLEFHSLMKGSFTFEKDESFNQDLPALTDKALATEASSDMFGRRVIKMPYKIEDWAMYVDESDDKRHLFKKNPIGVSFVGTGEHLYIPFLMAEKTEKTGIDVVFQSTTRSPILVDGDTIKSKDVVEVTRTNSLGEASPMVNHFIYNLGGDNRNIIVCPESLETQHWYKNLSNRIGVIR
ncbi:phosphoribosyltransferase domain-containing protein [Vibrio owensii]|uniref:phosphoribosyltransferase domain-containing protein n=1 Tax=Vibrio owensii TaxID=696485 RepID=UPI003CC50C20